MFAGIQVAVDNAAFQFDKLYSYNVPDDLKDVVQIGSRVLVPFGKGKPRMGIVLGACDPSPDYKYISDSEKGTPEITGEMVELIHFLKKSTFCTYYDAVKTVLPKNIRLVPDSEFGSIQMFSEAHTEMVYRSAEGWTENKVTKRQREILEYLAEPHTFTEICSGIGASRETVLRLAEKGLVIKESRWKEEIIDYSDPDVGHTEIVLSAAQQKAYDEILDSFEHGTNDTTLLHGVTSSGKTLIFIKIVEHIVSQGKGAILLVPEIALATQMIGRLQNHFRGRVGIIHSSLSDTERTLQWKKIKDGCYDVVVGTRSAVFAPLSNIGLIIIDEEQEETYTSDQAPRYKALSVASMRVKKSGGRLLLSSATPSVESYYRAVKNRYNLVSLTQRYGNMPLPEVNICDMRQELIEGNTGSIGSELFLKIRKRLDSREQSILLLNRRGYRTVTICRQCKKVVMCDSCSMPMVWHKQDNTHRCHYCGKVLPAVLKCPDCGGEMRHTGIGTEKIEEELNEKFPDARTLRIDLDSVSRKNSLVESLRDFRNGKYDIIIGTQMIAKGLDFPNVTLVGVLSVDSMLMMPSYKAFERTFDMLTQVVGRSGRGNKKGEAVIQTVDPYNPIIKLAANQDYRSFFENEIILRKAHLYPPFCFMCSVCFSAAKESEGKRTADRFSDLLSQAFSSHKDVPLRVMGPSPMRVAVVNGSYRWRLVLKSRGDQKFRDILEECLYRYKNMYSSDKTRIYVDFSNSSE